MNKIIFTVAMVAITLGIFAMSGGSAYAKKSPYESGFDHGCSDSHIDDPNDRYINQDEKGPAYHTNNFMQGYYAGFKECGYDNGVLITNPETNTAYDDSFNNRDSVVQPQAQNAVTSQSAGCPQMIVNGDCHIGQKQDVDNDFAQANRAEN